MRKITFIIIAIALTSCGASMKTSNESSAENLIQKVSFEQGCNADKIEILSKQQVAGNTNYTLDVCGKRMVYIQSGSDFTESSKTQRNTRSFEDLNKQH